MKLNELADIPGARKRRKRVGRGPGSGTGTTAGRGMNGQKARSGTALGAFEGGQMPIYQRLPKRGFRSRNKVRYATINLGTIQYGVESGKLDADRVIDAAVLVESGLVRRQRGGIKLLADGQLDVSVTLELQAASAAAKAAIEAAGGTLKLGDR